MANWQCWLAPSPCTTYAGRPATTTPKPENRQHSRSAGVANSERPASPSPSMNPRQQGLPSHSQFRRSAADKIKSLCSLRTNEAEVYRLLEESRAGKLTLPKPLMMAARPVFAVPPTRPRPIPGLTQHPLTSGQAGFHQWRAARPDLLNANIQEERSQSG